MTEIKYTTAHEELDSSLVWDVWYDAETRKAYVNLETVVYAYSDVPASAVDALVYAPSIGRHYNGSVFGAKGFKREFGPGEKLGYLADLTLREREVALASGGTITASGNLAAPGVVGKNLTYAPNAKVTTTDSNTANGRVSLRVIEDANAAPVVHKRAMTVHFESNGSRTHSLRAESVDEAVDAVKEVAKMLGVNVMVTGVFVHLG